MYDIIACYQNPYTTYAIKPHTPAVTLHAPEISPLAAAVTPLGSPKLPPINPIIAHQLSHFPSSYATCPSSYAIGFPKTSPHKSHYCAARAFWSGSTGGNKQLFLHVGYGDMSFPRMSCLLLPITIITAKMPPVCRLRRYIFSENESLAIVTAFLVLCNKQSSCI